MIGKIDLLESASFNLNLLECKAEKEHIMIEKIQVLISTYWNVKTGLTSAVHSSTCFNLNLLECKGINKIFVWHYRQF